MAILSFRPQQSGKMLRVMRKSRRLTLKELGEKTGLAVSYLSDLEHGRSNASMRTLETLAWAYGGAVIISFEYPYEIPAMVDGLSGSESKMSDLIDLLRDVADNLAELTDRKTDD